MTIDFPCNFPNVDDMFEIVRKTEEISWKSGLDEKTIDEWLANYNGSVFSAENERRLALWLLCNYTYFSPVDLNYLCKILYNRFVHDFVLRNQIPIHRIVDELKSLCFASIGSASESGGLILYHFRQEANLSVDRFFYPTDLPQDETCTIVFIDDVTLSGGTAAKNYYKVLQEKKYKTVYYLTIVASKEAVKKLEDFGIIVISCIHVDERNQCFSELSTLFNQFPSLRAPSKLLAEEYGKKIITGNEEPLGYKNGQYCFGFYYNTPNNTLPIFWSAHNWTPIFPRKEKLQNAKQLKFKATRFI